MRVFLLLACFCSVAETFAPIQPTLPLRRHVPMRAMDTHSTYALGCATGFFMPYCIIVAMHSLNRLMMHACNWIDGVPVKK